MEDINPFRPPGPARKRIVTASVTEAQERAIDRLQTKHCLKSRAAVLKLALAELIDRGEADA